MLRVDLSMAKPDMELALPVRHPQRFDQILLRVGYVLKQDNIIRLQEMGVGSLWVRYPSLDFLSKYVSQDVMKSQQGVIQDVSNVFERFQKQANAKIPYQDYCRSIEELVSHLAMNSKAAVFIEELACGQADDLMRHSSTVTYLTALMGIKLEGYLIRQRPRVAPSKAKDLVNLGVGAMLHDVGVMHLDSEVRERHRKAGDESDPEWQQHPVVGYQMVRGQVDASAATVVLNHHQRYNGSGYAGAKESGEKVPVLKGDAIHIFARITGLAEQFDRLMRPVNLPKQPTVWVLNSLLQEGIFEKFDPHVMRALLTVVPPYHPGSVARLSDGRWAACIDHLPTDPCRPVVQIIPGPDALTSDEGTGEIVDLSTQDKTLFIAEFEGQNVSELNFPAPALMRDPLLNVPVG